MKQSCYFNALAQSVYSLKSLRNNLLELQLPPVNKNSPQGLKTLSAFQDLFLKMSKGDGKPIDPEIAASSVLDDKGNSFFTGVQHDLTEFYNSLTRLLAEGWQYANGSMQNFSLIIQGNFEDYIGNSPVRTDTSLPQDLNPIVLPVHPRSFKKAMQIFFNDPLHESDGDYKVPTFMRKIVLVAPNHLVIQLKRTQFDAATQKASKTNSYFDYPLEFSLNSYTKVNKEAKYRLQAVMIHRSKSSTFGHYFAYVIKKNRWTRLDDEHIDKSSTAQMMKSGFGENEENESAYSLFYTLIIGEESTISSLTKTPSPRPVSPLKTYVSSLILKPTTKRLSPPIPQPPQRIYSEEEIYAEMITIFEMVKNEEQNNIEDKPKNFPRVENFRMFIIDQTTDPQERILFIRSALFNRFFSASKVLGYPKSLKAALSNARWAKFFNVLLEKSKMTLPSESFDTVEKILLLYKQQAQRIMITANSVEFAQTNPEVYIDVLLWSVREANRHNPLDQSFFEKALCNVVLIMLSQAKVGLKTPDDIRLYAKGLSFILTVNDAMQKFIFPNVTYTSMAKLINWREKVEVESFIELQEQIQKMMNKDKPLSRFSNIFEELQKLNMVDVFEIDEGTRYHLEAARESYMFYEFTIDSNLYELLIQNEPLLKIAHKKKISWLFK